MLTMNHLPPLTVAQREQFKKDAAEIDKQLEAQDNQPSNQFDEQAQQQLEAPTSEFVQQESSAEPIEEHKKSNWLQLRERAEAAEREKARIERERDELLQKMREVEYEKMQQQIMKMQQQISSQEQDVEPQTHLAQLEPDALAEGKHVSELHKENRHMKAQLKQFQQQTQQTLMEIKIKSQFPDFDTIVSRENVEELKRSHPAIAQTLAAALQNDPYNAAASTYSIIKQMGIDKSTQDVATTKRIIQENATKPRSAQSASPQRGSTPLSQANEYMYDSSGRKATKEYEQQLRDEMEAARRQLR